MPTAIKDLELTMRSYNCLKRHGIDTVGQLVKRTETDLLDIRNLGVGSLDDIIGRLAAHGLKLADGAK
jgi:DNA-directed RNA polymerase subunit alpha